MTVEPPHGLREEVDIREEVDVVRVDPLFIERQRNRYASRGVAFLVILNGIAALLLLASFVRLSPQVGNARTVAAAMVVLLRRSQACSLPTSAALSQSRHQNALR